MKKYLVFVLLVLPSYCYALMNPYMFGITSSGGACTTTITDPFEDADLGDYTQEQGTWVLDTTNDNLDTPGNFSSQMIYHNTSTTTVTQWAKVTVVTQVYNNTDGIMFRVPATGNYYRLTYRENGNSVSWYSQNMDQSGATLIQTSTAHGLSPSSGDVWGYSITGTGNDTIARVWLNPTGATPCDWGPADVTFEDDPATAVDTGTNVGYYHNAGAAATIDSLTFGDW